MKLLLAALFLAAVSLPASAADAPARTRVHTNADTWAQTENGYELRRYYLDAGRAYGGPVSYYARITPAPPTRFLYAEGARGRARVEIDDRPPFPGADWIKLIE
jgi:hypothetical protein